MFTFSSAPPLGGADGSSRYGVCNRGSELERGKEVTREGIGGTAGALPGICRGLSVSLFFKCLCLARSDCDCECCKTATHSSVKRRWVIFSGEISKKQKIVGLIRCHCRGPRWAQRARNLSSFGRDFSTPEDRHMAIKSNKYAPCSMVVK